PTLLPLLRISFTTSALYSFVNDLLALAMDSILHHIGGVHEIGAGSDPFVLHGHRCVHSLPGLDAQLFEFACHPLRLRLALHHESSIPGPPAVVREAQECE